MYGGSEEARSGWCEILSGQAGVVALGRRWIQIGGRCISWRSECPIVPLRSCGSDAGFSGERVYKRCFAGSRTLRQQRYAQVMITAVSVLALQLHVMPTPASSPEDIGDTTTARGCGRTSHLGHPFRLSQFLMAPNPEPTVRISSRSSSVSRRQLAISSCAACTRLPCRIRFPNKINKLCIFNPKQQTRAANTSAQHRNSLPSRLDRRHDRLGPPRDLRPLRRRPHRLLQQPHLLHPPPLLLLLGDSLSLHRTRDTLLQLQCLLLSRRCCLVARPLFFGSDEREFHGYVLRAFFLLLAYSFADDMIDGSCEGVDFGCVQAAKGETAIREQVDVSLCCEGPGLGRGQQSRTVWASSQQPNAQVRKAESELTSTGLCLA